MASARWPRSPSAVWIVDTNKEHLAVEEARKLKIPIIGILDSNCDPDLVDFPIPGNDDAIRAVGLLTRVVADAVAEGLIARSGGKTEASAIGAAEPLADWERELLEGDATKAAVEATGGDATTEAPGRRGDRRRVRGSGRCCCRRGRRRGARRRGRCRDPGRCRDAPSSRRPPPRPSSRPPPPRRPPPTRLRPRSSRWPLSPRRPSSPVPLPPTRTARLPRASTSRATRTR